MQGEIQESQEEMDISQQEAELDRVRRDAEEDLKEPKET